MQTHSSDEHAKAAALRKQAEDGDADSQLVLASFLELGVGFPTDIEEALYWYSRAADGGNLDAQIELGNRYKDGKDLPEDNVRAYVWFYLASILAADESLLGTISENIESLEADMTLQEIEKAKTLIEKWTETHAAILSAATDSGSTPQDRYIPSGDGTVLPSLYDQMVEWYRKVVRANVFIPRMLSGLSANGTQFLVILSYEELVETFEDFPPSEILKINQSILKLELSTVYAASEVVSYPSEESNERSPAIAICASNGIRYIWGLWVVRRDDTGQHDLVNEGTFDTEDGYDPFQSEDYRAKAANVPCLTTHPNILISNNDRESYTLFWTRKRSSVEFWDRSETLESKTIGGFAASHDGDTETRDGGFKKKWWQFWK